MYPEFADKQQAFCGQHVKLCNNIVGVIYGGPIRKTCILLPAASCLWSTMCGQQDHTLEQEAIGKWRGPRDREE